MKQLVDFFNLSFMVSVYPLVLKLQKLFLLFLKKLKLDCSKYRPMSLLSNIGKILENKTFNNKNMICNSQFGFKQQCSRSHALINITENIRTALDDGNIIYRVFYIVDHQMPFSKLNQMIGLNPMYLIIISIYQ